ncbi:response regulator [Kordiimonas sp. SCSIO 12610]|uniref:response regulator n=1 Tax=Kordiimonas sp. SCSIO 12610 TaxID=2829597 RepID=UPI00210E15FD|nr:response regulator transcription factor [Kordiimonas sp. SCSIO 12610]UTW54364.1 response regulator transcription factor [Kordiimonas sp. SCSIO 12610]
MQVSADHIIVCDDEAPIRKMLKDHLGECGYKVDEAENASVLNSLLGASEPSLIILDVRMPGVDGLETLREIRKGSNVPVMMLTAAGEIVDKVLGLELGADDYLVKPVDLRELQARVKAAIRRGKVPQGDSHQGSKNEGDIDFGGCRLDTGTAKLYDRQGEPIPITAMEYRLLCVFAENRGRVLSRDQLLEQAHDRGWEPFDRSIDLRISRLRRKIETDPSKPSVIRTVHGLGYVYG